VIRCACLLETRQNEILLVRVRDNSLWYLPGGTIEAEETPQQALVREVSEELDVQVDTNAIRFDRRVIGPALGRDGEVELNCFRAEWSGEPSAQSEISEIGYISFEDTHKMAPAVRLLVKELDQLEMQ